MTILLEETATNLSALNQSSRKENTLTLIILFIPIALREDIIPIVLVVLMETTPILISPYQEERIITIIITMLKMLTSKIYVMLKLMVEPKNLTSPMWVFL